MTPEPPRRQVPLDQITKDDVRRVLGRVIRKQQDTAVPVAKFGSAI